MAEAEKKPRGFGNAIRYAAIALLWGVLLLHFFADLIWDREPAVLRWVVIGYGALVLSGLLGSLVAGKRDERIVALLVLAVVAVVVAAAVIPWQRDRQADAAADALVVELTEKGAEIERYASSLPPIPEKPNRDELVPLLQQARDQIHQQSEGAADLLRRADKAFPRASADKRAELRQALKRLAEQMRAAKEKREPWMAQLRERVAALKK